MSSSLFVYIPNRKSFLMKNLYYRSAPLHDGAASYNRQVDILRIQVQCGNDQTANRMRGYSSQTTYGKIYLSI